MPMAPFNPKSNPVLIIIIILSLSSLSAAWARTVYFDFKVQYVNITRICHTKQVVSINGQFPGPTMFVREGDNVVVNVTNLVPHNMTIHWHGVRQLLSAWADGPAYITQCPIQTGKSYVHRFRMVEQRGTLLYHAHISWLRATVHGAFVILPKSKGLVPYRPPKAQFPVVLGEWWNAEVEDVIAEALKIGGPYNISDALTINGQPGVLYNCSLDGTSVFEVEKGQTYLLKLINAAVNFHLYVGVAGHNLTIVNADAEYTEPLTREIVVLAPGQTSDVLLTANQAVGQYLLAASVFSPANPSAVPYPTIPTTAIIRYKGASTNLSLTPSLSLPSFPLFNDSIFVANFTQSLRGLPIDNSSRVPQTYDENLFFTVGYALNSCPNCTFRPFPGLRLSASINNVTFVDPLLSLQQAYYYNVNGTYQGDFPSNPLFEYNYTGAGPTNRKSELATKVKLLKFNSKVQLILQNTAVLFFENHPIHLHGQNFYIVGSGFGTFNETKDTPNFNLINPPFRNTIGVPAGGWAALRFTADNPGVWFMHCHFDFHSSMGMSMVFITENGKGRKQTLPPPPSDLPQC